MKIAQYCTFLLGSDGGFSTGKRMHAKLDHQRE